jgi:hypothetical protein
MKPIRTLNQLKKTAINNQGEFSEFFIMIGDGLAKSSKRIIYFPQTKTFDVHNEIDDSYQEDLTEKQLSTETNIVNAIKKGALFQY